MNSSISGSKAFLAAFGVCFAVLFGGSIAATEAMLRRHVVPFDDEAEYRRRFATSTASAAAFGDSHVANGLTSTESFDNFGRAADNWSTVNAKINARLSRGGLKQVILQADPQYFAPYRLNADQAARLDDLMATAEPPLAILRPSYRQYLMRFWWTVIMDPALLVRVPVAPVAPPPFVQWSEAEQQHETTLRVQLHTPVADPERTEAARELEAVVSRLKAAQVEVCLVAFPVTHAYWAASQNSPAFATTRAYFQSFAGRQGVKFADLSQAYSDEMFADPDHLMRERSPELLTRATGECFAQAAGRR